MELCRRHNSKERRLDPQITIGLLTDATGIPLMVAAFEGNKAETATMLPVINAFKATHHLSDVTVIADAGMISEANQTARSRQPAFECLLSDSGNPDRSCGSTATRPPSMPRCCWHLARPRIS